MRPKLTFLLLIAVFFAAKASSVAATAEIPFEFRDGLVWVKLSTAAGQPLNFVLDSGAGASVLDLQTARQLGLRLGSPQNVQAVGAQAKAYRITDFAAQAGEIPIRSKNVLAMDLSAASAACSQRIGGLLGQDFFRNRIVQIDFKTRRLRILQSADTSRCCAVLPLKFHGDAMCVPVGLDGTEPRWTRLDTGCNDALHWVAADSKRVDFSKTSVGLSRSTGGTLSTIMQLGNEQIPNVKTAVHVREIFAGEAGLLGNGILAKYCVTVDAVHKRVLIQK